MNWSAIPTWKVYLVTILVSIPVVIALAFWAAPHDPAPPGAGVSSEVWNDADSLFHLGQAHQIGQQRPRDQAKARLYLTRAAALGNGWAMMRLGKAYSYGWGVPVDTVAATRWYDKAITCWEDDAAEGDMKAQYCLGWLNEHRSPARPAEAFKWFKEAAGNGSAAAAYELGYCYDDGWGTAADPAQALNWYQKVAATDPQAAYRLANLYEAGRGTTANPALALKWFKVAAADSNAVAAFNVGMHYQQGLGVAPDPAQARRWYEQAAAAGNVKAMNNLGSLYDLGLGVPADPCAAQRWYERAAVIGTSTTAACNLARHYLDGACTHGKRDAVAARPFLQQAVALGQAPGASANDQRVGQEAAELLRGL